MTTISQQRDNEEALCKHELDVRWCKSCKEGPKRADIERKDYAFNARYSGQCPECNLPIVPNQRLIMTTRHRVLHQDCMPVEVGAK